MKKNLTLFILSFFVLICLSSALEYLPENFYGLFYVPDVAKFYDGVKSTEIGNAIFEMLGIESMLDGLITSYLSSYDIDSAEFYKIKELLLMNGKNWAALIAGPIKDFDKYRNMLSDMGVLNEQIEIYGKSYTLKWIKLDEYGMIFIGPDAILEEIKNRTGQIPEWVLDTIKDDKVLSVSFAEIPGEYTSKSKTFLVGKVLKIEGEGKIHDEDVRKKVLKAMYAGKLSENLVTNGEGFVMINLNDFENLKDLLETFNIDITDDDTEEFFEYFEGQAFISADYTQSIISAIGGDQVATPTVSVSLKVKNTKKLLDEILNDESCKKVGEDKYRCIADNEDFDVVISGDLFRMRFPAGKEPLSENAKNAFKKFYTGKENILIFLDFSNLVNQLFGMEITSYGMLRIWHDGGIIRLSGELR